MTVKSLEQRQRTGARNEQIRKEYGRMWKKGLRAEKIFEELGKRYFLSVSTIESIVFKKGVYADF
jgi:hypothetical protein